MSFSQFKEDQIVKHGGDTVKLRIDDVRYDQGTVHCTVNEKKTIFTAKELNSVF